MYRFFVQSDLLRNDNVKITGNDYYHIKNVLRMKVGEKVLLSDGHDMECEAMITGYSEDLGVLLKIVDVFGTSRELPARITLFQGYPKGDKMEQIVQKAVELGAYEIVPVMMNRCVVKLDEKKAEKKTERLNAIALSAAKQSKRGIIPKVNSPVTFEEAVMLAKKLDYNVVPYECADGMEGSGKNLERALEHDKIGVFIGPEGGFDKMEIERLEELGGKIISLGQRILRTETAGMVVLSLLMYMFENKAFTHLED